MTDDPEIILSALGPLAGFYADPNILAIMVDGPERVLVEREGVLVDAGVKFSSGEDICSILDNLFKWSGETAKPGQTIFSIHFPDRKASGLVVLPPTASQGPCLVIRKLLNTGWISWEKLIEFNSITPEGYEFLQRAIKIPVNILMAGGTGSGKTTLANRIAELIPSEARLIVVEDIHELQIRHPRATYLEAAGSPDVSIQDLILAGSKMRPDWLIIGELFGAEAMRVVEILSRGHTGMTTIHANGLEDALARLEAMCLTANTGMRLIEIRNLIAAAIQIICYQKRMPDGKRRIVEIVEVRGIENGKYTLERLFCFNAEKDRLEATGVGPSWE